MTQSVDQTPTAITWRRHKDPPSLWIAVVTSSVALHLLVFWLMRSSNVFSPWFPQQDQAAIPIEIVEISPTATSTPKQKLKAKTVSPPPSTNKQSTAAPLPERSQLTPRNQNSGGINFAARRQQRKSNTFTSKSNTQVPQQSVPIQPTPTRTPTLTSTPKPKPKPKPTDSFGNLPWNRRRDELSLGKPTPLPSFTPIEPRDSRVSDPFTRRNRPTPISEDSPTPTRRTPRQPIAEDSPTPTRRTPRQPIEEDSPTTTRKTPQPQTGEDSQTPRKTPQPQTGGGIIAISRFVTPEEQRSLMGRNAPPKGLILPEHIGSNEKQINSISLKPNLDLPEGEFLASLVIDKNGNFVQAEVVDPAIAPGERRKYQEFANSIFQGEKFQPPRSTNGTPPPDFTNRFVRIKIQRR